MTKYYNSSLVRANRDTLATAIGTALTLVDNEIKISGDHSDIIDNNFFGSVTQDENEFYSSQDTLRITGRSESFEKWEEFVNSIVPAGTIDNNFFQCSKPNDETSNSFLETQIIYNKSFFRYENYTKSLNTKMLPSQVLIEEEHDLASFSPVGLTANNNDFSYFENYVENLQDIFNNSSTYISRNSNIFILKDIGNDYVSGIPGYLKIDLETHLGEGAFVDDIEDIKRKKFLFQFIKNNTASISMFTTEEGGRIALGTYDVLEWLSTFSEINKFSEGSDEVFLCEEGNMDYESDFVNNLYNFVLLSVVKSSVSNNMRDHLSTIDGVLANTEAIGFKVEKYLDVDRGSPIQTFYLDGRDVSFIDCQMKHGQKYVYVVTSLVAVYGSNHSYSIESLNDNGEDDFDASFSMTITPSFKIYEVPFGKTEEVYVEMPPNIPSYSFANESGKKAVKILLNSNFIESEEEFVGILNPDFNFFNNVALAQKNEATKSSHMFSSGQFEIYRISEKPSNYSDFANGFVSIVRSSTHLSTAHPDGHFGEETIQPYSYSSDPKSAEFVDVVSANKKYYYLFRELTEHANPSNPTEIIELELIEDSDETYIVTSPFYFDQRRDFSYKKEMKRFMQIVPNPEQATINEEHNTYHSANDISESNLSILGPHPEELFSGKKFKIRLTSRHTGKKIDVNIQFGKKIK